ncbi:MAG: cobalt-zinc-cadmium efflux system outer membrane protein [Phycisphaerales bacterium]|jgi:cobalt-zinc-cadmium efflux system outer membrane protein
MHPRLCARAIGVAAWLAPVTLIGCAGPLDPAHDLTRDLSRSGRATVAADRSVYAPTRLAVSAGESRSLAEAQPLTAGSTPDDYIRRALAHNPEIEAARQRWIAAAQRAPQVGALPDPRVTVGFFADEVETRVGAQQARVGIKQSFPWPGTLGSREDAAVRAAKAAWWGLESARLGVAEAAVAALHEVALLDASIGVARENLQIVVSIEPVVRTRYASGLSAHAELMRVQLELGQAEDRLKHLVASRPASVARLNAVLRRGPEAAVPELAALPGWVASASADELVAIAMTASPALHALDETLAQQQHLTDVARDEGRPAFTLGLDYTVTDEAANSAIAESGDDPVMLSLGLTIPLWRDKYRAGVRESVANRLAVASDRASRADRIAAAVHAAWFTHTDAHRRVLLYEGSLIPKAHESLSSTLEGFRVGESSFLDLLDAERTLLEFSLEVERARAHRGQSLATLHRLVGEPIPVEPADETQETSPAPDPEPDTAPTEAQP